MDAKTVCLMLLNVFFAKRFTDGLNAAVEECGSPIVIIKDFQFCFGCICELILSFLMNRSEGSGMEYFTTYLGHGIVVRQKLIALELPHGH